MGHIFISYSHKDKEYVHKLQDTLQEKGFEVWMDDRIGYGTKWPTIIQKQLDECDAFIVVVTENAFESRWVQNEVARADRKSKPFFPLLLQGEPWLSVESTQYIDVRDGSLPTEEFYEHLARVTSSTLNSSSSPSQNRGVKRLLPWIAFIAIILAFGSVLVLFLTRPTFSKLDAFSADSRPIDKDYAPYDVLIDGNVLNAKGYYLYLIVDDGHKQWIQNPIGKIPDDDHNFSGHCYLGASEDDPDAKNQTFTIYAVISDRGSYIEYGDFTGQPAKARSEPISLIRQDSPGP